MRLQPRRTSSPFPRARNLKVAGALCVLAAAVLVTGCGRNAESTSSTPTTEAAKAVPQSTTTPTATGQLTQKQQQRKQVLEATEITFDKAAATAVGEVSGGTLIDLHLEGVDDEDQDSETVRPSATAGSGTGSPVWFAEVAEKDGTVHVVRIDAVTGKVVESSPESGQDAEDKQETARLVAGASQTAQQAAKAATQRKQGTVTSADLHENETNDIVWAVDVVDSYWSKTDFEVNADNGTIIHEDTDDD